MACFRIFSFSVSLACVTAVGLLRPILSLSDVVAPVVVVEAVEVVAGILLRLAVVVGHILEHERDTLERQSLEGDTLERDTLERQSLEGDTLAGDTLEGVVPIHLVAVLGTEMIFPAEGMILGLASLVLL
jgi:hypothetical protein